jgi:hypothetical protein
MKRHSGRLVSAAGSIKELRLRRQTYAYRQEWTLRAFRDGFCASAVATWTIGAAALMVMG